mgnify:CR=1 FL=1
MKIDHVALWVKNLEKMKTFYVDWFGGKASEKYNNPDKNFSSYFISFSSGSRLELMHHPDIVDQPDREMIGLTHFSVSVGSKDLVDQMTHKIAGNGYVIASAPRKTGDGYYEGVIIEPEGNRIEITI